MLSIGFAALAYEQPGQNQHAYQLVGVNPTGFRMGTGAWLPIPAWRRAPILSG
ncbi:hypothetical protein [Spirosoma jeollabukense]